MTIGEIIPVQPYDYMIFPHDSKFKVKWGGDGTTVYETTDQTDAYGAFEYCRDQMLARGETTWVKPFYHVTTPWYPMSQTLQFDANIHKNQGWRACAGPWSKGVQLRATTNNPLLEFTTSGASQQHSNSFENFYLTHNQSGYTKNLIHFLDGSIDTVFRGLRIEDNSQYKGNAIGFEILTVDKSQYCIIFDTVMIRGFENAFYVNIQQTSSITFASSIILDKIMAWNCKRVIKAEGIVGGKLLAVDFSKVHFQWSTSNSLATGESVYDFTGNLSNLLIRMNSCETWDIPSDTFQLGAGAASEIMEIGCDKSHMLTGAGAAKVKTLDYYSFSDGKATIAPVAGTKEYTITHGLSFIPRKITATLNMNDDTVIPYTIPEKDWIITPTKTFKIKFQKSPPLSNNPAVTNSIIVSWRAWF